MSPKGISARCRGCDSDSKPRGPGALILHTVFHLSPTLGALLDLKDGKCQEAKLLMLQSRPANQPPAALGPAQREGDESLFAQGMGSLCPFFSDELKGVASFPLSPHLWRG